jgi:hypothetical protein
MEFGVHWDRLTAVKQSRTRRKIKCKLPEKSEIKFVIRKKFIDELWFQPNAAGFL